MDSMLSIRDRIKKQVREQRKFMKLSQLELSQHSGVSFGSIKRFESTGEISLTSLLKIAMVLGCETDFNALFSRKFYQSLEDVINETK